MIKVLAFLKRKDGISSEDFRKYYEEKHVPLVGDVAPRMAAYRRNYLDLGNPSNQNEDQIDFDVVTELEFDDRAHYENWVAHFRDPDSTSRIIADELEFIDRARLRSCIVEQVSRQSGDE